MYERIRGSYDDALYKSTSTLLYTCAPGIVLLKDEKFAWDLAYGGQ